MSRLDTIDQINKPGAKNDAGKLRYELLDDLADEALTAVMTFGAKKYTPNGWRQVVEPLDRYYAALRRHAREMRRFQKTGDPKDRFDRETGFPHSAQLLCNAYFICAIDLAVHQGDFDGAAAAEEAWKRWQAQLAAKLKAESMSGTMAPEHLANIMQSLDQCFPDMPFDDEPTKPTKLTGKAKSGRAGGLASARARRKRAKKR